MKMLGQDLLTVEEFDMFKKQEFAEIAATLVKVKRWLTGLSLACVVLAAADVSILLMLAR